MTAIRDIDRLDADFAFKVRNFLGDARIKELGVFITESFRTQERQIDLYQQGRSKPWNIVTWVDWVQDKSEHQIWKAIDIAFHWEELYPADFAIWREVWDLAKVYWIAWGYDLWGKDKPHFQDDWTIPAQKELEEYKWLTLQEKIKKLSERPITYQWLSLKDKIARLKARFKKK